MLQILLLAALIILSAITDASAQATTTEGFDGLGDARRLIIVVDDSGVETWGRLVGLTADELTVSVSGRDRTFARQRVATIFERGDSLKNGALIGLATGAVLGLASGVTQNACGDFWTGLHHCTTSEKAHNATAGGLILGSFGAAVGVGIDALRNGRHVVYRRSSAAASPTETTTPNFSRSLVSNRTVSVIDDSGFDWRGRLVTFTPESLTVEVNGSDVTFDRSKVMKIYERGNSVKKGMMFGALAGPALWVAAVATDGGDAVSGEGAAFAVIFSALGFAVGTAVDAMIPGKHLIYERGRGNIGRQSSITISPSLSPKLIGVSTSVSW